MAVIPADLKQAAGGRIDPSTMFPDEDVTALDDRLQAYIDEADVSALSVQSEIDAAVKQWAYYRAFDAVFIRLSADASSVQLNDEGSASLTSSQIQNFRELSDAALAEYNEIIAIAPEPASTATGWNVVSSLRHA